VDGIRITGDRGAAARQPGEEADPSLAGSHADRAIIFAELVETARAPVAIAAARLSVQGHTIAGDVALYVRPDLDQPLGRIRKPLPY
jgi:hypothetical protein